MRLTARHYHVQELPADLGGQETALLAWNHVYENVRPHSSLGNLTPEEFRTDYTKRMAAAGL